MVLLSGLLGSEGFVRSRINGGATHQDIATELQMYYGLPGLSARSVRRFCASRHIHRSSQLSAQSVDEVVERAVAQVRSSVTL